MPSTRILIESARAARDIFEMCHLLELIAYQMQQGPRGGWFYYTPNEKKVYRHLRRGGPGAHKATGEDYYTAWAGVEGGPAAAAALKEIFGDKAPDPNQLKRMVSAPGINAKISRISVDRDRRSGGPSVNVGYHVFQRDGQRIDSTLNRTFTKDSRGPHVHHDYFAMKEEFQGGGRGGAMLASSMKEYKKMGIKAISVHAALQAGPYTWLRFGFKPKDPASIVFGFKGFLSRAPREGGLGLSPADVDQLMKKVGDDPRKLTSIKIKGKNTSTGKEEVIEAGKDYMLHGDGGHSVSWSGEVDMTNKTQVGQFKAQARKGLKKREAAMAKGKDNLPISEVALEKHQEKYDKKRSRYSRYHAYGGDPEVTPVTPVRVVHRAGSDG